MLFFHFVLAQTNHYGTPPALQAPRSPLCHLGYFVLCAVWLSCLCLPSPRASGYCVSVHGSHLHLATRSKRYLQSGHCEPVMLMSSVMCVLMLLWGLLCSFVPKLLPLCQSGVSGSVYFSPRVHFSLSLRLFLLPPHPLYSLGVCRAQPAPGTGSFLTP